MNLEKDFTSFQCYVCPQTIQANPSAHIRVFGMYSLMHILNIKDMDKETDCFSLTSVVSLYLCPEKCEKIPSKLNI